MQGSGVPPARDGRVGSVCAPVNWRAIFSCPYGTEILTLFAFLDKQSVGVSEPMVAMGLV